MPTSAISGILHKASKVVYTFHPHCIEVNLGF